MKLENSTKVSGLAKTLAGLKEVLRVSGIYKIQKEFPTHVSYGVTSEINLKLSREELFTLVNCRIESVTKELESLGVEVGNGS